VRVRAASALIAVALLIALIGFFVARCWSDDNYQYYAHKLPDAKQAYDFKLTDQEGKPFSLGTLRGKLVILDFGYTHCPNICPTTLANLATAYELLSPAEQARVQVIFLTVDPERDSTKVLKDYVPFFDKHFIALTGQPDQVAATATAYGVESERTSQTSVGGVNYYTIDHSTGVFVIGPSGKLVGYYRDRQLNNGPRIADDLRHLLALSPRDDYDWQSDKKDSGVVKAPPPSGRQLYLEQCASCHLENGRGLPGKYPSLVGSAWVLGAPNRLTALVLDGVKGRKEESGAPYAGVMPALRTVLTPAYTASVLTYIRQAWGNAAPAVSAPYVQKLSYRFHPRPDFWSWKELDALPPDTQATPSGP
jgi:protein SCO1/2